jgi:hypothetical protein
MKYSILILILLLAYGCKKEEDAKPMDPVTVNSGNQAFPDTQIYVGQYVTKEVYDDAAYPVYTIDTNFLDSMVVVFSDSVNINCKLYTYTMFHSRISRGQGGVPGWDSLEFSCKIEAPYTSLMSYPVLAGSIKFSAGRDSIHFYELYMSGQSNYFHQAAFSGKRQ